MLEEFSFWGIFFRNLSFSGNMLVGIRTFRGADEICSTMMPLRTYNICTRTNEILRNRKALLLFI